ncbi:hypothetical protein A9Q99_23580 [Gammaproteobacteria bacterium 45_16_T64]|nr:hypothetical protein A9Q99_23580 [Gammaproteobacteria bacterium 45_16_T64]
MATDLQHHFQQLAQSQVPLWIDGWKYGLALLNDGQQPDWSDTAATVAYLRTLQGLVKSDVITLHVEDFYTYWIEKHPELLVAMGEKRRLGFALRTLLADADARQQLDAIIFGLCEGYKDTPVVLALPSPKQWITKAHCTAKAINNVQVTWDDAESASMYIADFLRHFSQRAISGILLQDNAQCGPNSDNDIARYQPILNIADNYQWHVLIDGCQGDYSPSPRTGIAYSLQSIDTHSAQQNSKFSPDDIIATGLKLDLLHWRQVERSALLSAHFYFSTLPLDAKPEVILEKIAELKNASRLTPQEVSCP